MTPPVTVTPVGHLPNLAWSGNYLGVAWFSGERGTTPADVQFARVSQVGVSMDTPPIRLTSGVAHGGDDHVQVAWNGLQYGVSWLAANAGGTATNVMMVRVTGEGGVLEPVQPFAAPSSLLSVQHRLIWNEAAAMFAAVWSDYSSAFVFGRATSGGAPVGQSMLASGPAGGASLAARADGSYVVAWDDRSNTFVRRLGPSGMAIGGDLFLAGHAAGMDASGSEIGLLRPGFNLARFDSSLGPVGTPTPIPDLVDSARLAGQLGVTWAGDRWIVYWFDSYQMTGGDMEFEVHARQVASDGTLLGGLITLVPRAASLPWLGRPVWTGSLVAFVYSRFGSGVSFATLVCQ